MTRPHVQISDSTNDIRKQNGELAQSDEIPNHSKTVVRRKGSPVLFKDCIQWPSSLVPINENEAPLAHRRPGLHSGSRERNDEPSYYMSDPNYTGVTLQQQPDSTKDVDAHPNGFSQPRGLYCWEPEHEEQKNQAAGDSTNNSSPTHAYRTWNKGTAWPEVLPRRSAAAAEHIKYMMQTTKPGLITGDFNQHLEDLSEYYDEFIQHPLPDPLPPRVKLVTSSSVFESPVTQRLLDAWKRQSTFAEIQRDPELLAEFWQRFAATRKRLKAEQAVKMDEQADFFNHRQASKNPKISSKVEAYVPPITSTLNERQNRHVETEAMLKSMQQACKANEEELNIAGVHRVGAVNEAVPILWYRQHKSLVPFSLSHRDDMDKRKPLTGRLPRLRWRMKPGAGTFNISSDPDDYGHKRWPENSKIFQRMLE